MFAVFALQILTQIGFAQSPVHPAVTARIADCDEYDGRFGALQYYRMNYGRSDTCFVSVGPNDTMDMKYRSYLSNEDGMLMIFNSFSDKDDINETGARVFTFFPHSKAPHGVVVKQEDGTEIFKLSTTHPDFEMVFNLEGRMIATNKGEVKEDPKVHPNNKGGIEFKNLQVAYLDSGFRRGGDPRSVMKQKIAYYDHLGTKCDIYNGDVFRTDSDGDIFLKYNDADLKKYLIAKCPRLKFDY